MTLGFLKDYDFFTGVPDSLLQPLCNYLMQKYGANNAHHIIAANEGNCVALAAGHYLATGKVPVVYLQNSGIGNIVNPVASLLNDKVYGIPCIFLVGWRGEPGVHDEPQHVFQGEVTVKLLEDIGIATCVLSKDTTEEQAAKQLEAWQPLLQAGKQVAFVVKKGTFTFDGKMTYKNDNPMLREEIIRRIVKAAGDDVIISTTGKASRELFELREEAGETHGKDFLTVGSMGHSSSIALKIAMEKH
ncbi:MAG: phosphonopyruvate decarboxylase, partial [Clostridia bacterium]|nr:phosphonopyruvate decarboxylase [Clostridia bacterium]